MKTPERFTNAVTKLYNAFHKGELNYSDCAKCAVGNMVGHGRWLFSCPDFIWNNKEKDFEDFYIYENSSGYGTKELIEVERLFIMAFKETKNKYDKESQFKGLCAVVEYLCELEGIPNVMDYQSLFETENEQPVKKLEEVFV